jgi:putative phosphoribosyl transferase
MHETIPVKIPPRGLSGDLVLPDGHRMIVVFAQHAGAGRAHATAMAEALADAGFGALLLDLMTEKTHLSSPATAVSLADGVVDAIDWVRSQPRYRGVDLGLCASGDAAAAVLEAAARRSSHIASVVVYEGWTDLAGEWLARQGAYPSDCRSR